MKIIGSYLFILMVLISCFMGSSGFAAGSPESPDMLNNTLSGSGIEVAPLNPEFVESMFQSQVAQETYMDENGTVLGNGYKPSPVDLTGMARSNRMLLVKAPGSDLPAVFDLRKDGKTTAAGNQGQSGCCWAFSSLASLESCLLGREGVAYDFSENNMKNLLSENYSEGFDLAPDEGGNAKMAAAYLTRWTGPVSESDDPYSDTSVYSPAGLPIQKHVQEVLFLPLRIGSLDNGYLKDALLKYGAVYTTMYWDSKFYQDTNNAYRCTESQNANHAITIVGWDDYFDKNKFNQVPPGDGAFIVKNNWGQAWGEGGYFYVSYYDTKLGYDENAVFTAEKKDNYDYIYQYDTLGWIAKLGYQNSLSTWGGNVFTAKGNETLRAVGFYTTDLNTVYDIYIYENPSNGPLNSGRAFSVHERGTYSLPGYHTYVLNSPVKLRQGEKYSVIVKVNNPLSGYTLAIEQPIAYYSSKAKASAGESYVSPNGVNWEDISKSLEANVCIKAFTTTDSLPESGFTSNITEGTYPLTVGFTDLSKNAFSWEWDLNGDGITDSTARNPTYTYTSYGNYTVTLRAGNRIGFDSETKSSYVNVTPLTIISTNPQGKARSVQGDLQKFSLTTNHICNVNWYLDGELKVPELDVDNSSYYNGSLAPGLYNVTAIAEVGEEKTSQTWEWTVHVWNPWESSTSRDGNNITTAELQEAIHYYQNGLQIPRSRTVVTGELLKEFIKVWQDPFN